MDTTMNAAAKCTDCNREGIATTEDAPVTSSLPAITDGKCVECTTDGGGHIFCECCAAWNDATGSEKRTTDDGLGEYTLCADCARQHVAA